MKKINFLMVALLFVATTSSYAQKNGIIGNGTSTNIIIGFPSTLYGLSDGDETAGEMWPAGTVFGIEAGNRWYFNPSETMGFGIMVNWIDFSYSQKESNGIARGVLDLTFLELGPIGTYALSSQMAIDGYYNLRPTILSSALVGSVSGVDVVYAGFGFSHAIGAAFRYNIFNVGLEYGFGGVNAVGTSSDASFNLAEANIKTNSFRIKLGMKF